MNICEVGLKVSIVVPVYNVEAFLREALDSVISQTCSDWECICVDDGSSDGSPGILQEYADRDCRFKVLRQDNAGVSAARNAGLAVASGDFVAFLDPDDRLHPECLSLALVAAESRPGAVVIWGWQTLSKDGEVHNYDAPGPLREVESPGPGVWNKLYPREKLEGVEFCVGAIVAEDIDFQLQIVHRHKAMFVKMEPILYFYRERNESAMHRVLHPRDFAARAMVIEHMVSVLADDRMALVEFSRKRLPSLLKQFYRYLRMVAEDERGKAKRLFAEELASLQDRGLLRPQQGSIKDFKYYLRFLVMSWRARRCQRFPY